MYPEDLLYRRRVTAPRQPMDERLPDGRSVMDLMAGMPTLAASPAVRPRVVTPTTPAAVGPPPPGGPMPVGPVPPVQIGQPVAGDASPLQRLLAERRALSEADPSSQVKRRD